MSLRMAGRLSLVYFLAFLNPSLGTTGLSPYRQAGQSPAPHVSGRLSPTVCRSCRQWRIARLACRGVRWYAAST